jgi:hypothetical protein
MSQESNLPSFDQFSRWLAGRLDQPPRLPERYEALREAARAARDEFVRAHHTAAAGARQGAAAQSALEVLCLLAAADKSESSQLPEITTPRGFRVTLAYDEGDGTGASSIAVLVHCPTELIAAVEGKTAYLWYGTERFELGQFDGDGKAIGELPAGIELSGSDFAQGRVKLEEPRPTA